MVATFNILFYVPLICLLNAKLASFHLQKLSIRTKYKVVFHQRNDRVKLSSFREVITSYSRIRDYYRNGNDSKRIWAIGNYPMIVVANIIAESVNATLVSTREATEERGFDRYPEIQITFAAIWARTHDHRNKSLHLIDKVPAGIHLIPIPASNWIFLYADLPRLERISVWDFSLFTDPLDLWTWLLLQTAYLFVVPLSGHFTRVIMPILAATLSFGTTGPPTKSKIFLLWMVTCMIVGNLYSGEVTSQIMIPPKDEVMTEFRQLVERNYTMVFPGASSASGLHIKIAQEFLAKRRSRAGQILAVLLNNAIVLDIRDIAETLAFRQGNFAVIGPWPNMYTILWAYYLAWNHEKKVKRKCHIGGELLKTSEKFFIFIPPQSDILAKRFLAIQESGIYERWNDEEDGLMHSMRVQDRVRVKSPTKLLENTITQAESQILEGKMITLFLLWGVCIVISLFGLVIEFVFKKLHFISLKSY